MTDSDALDALDPEAARVLRAADRDLGAEVGALRSLAPGASRATPLTTLAQTLLDATAPADLQRAFACALDAILRAQLDSFPGNLFWDLDLPAAAILRAAQTSPDPVAHLRDAAARIVTLERLFGRHTPIRFRYVHDFIYGFDWCRWVADDPPARAHVGPFDRPFLDHIHRRGHELLDLIARDDAKYPRLRDDAPRNPFGFSRAPDDEARLHQDLARRGLIPVEAWRVDVTPVWSRPYAALRAERARALGIPTR